MLCAALFCIYRASHLADAAPPDSYAPRFALMSLTEARFHDLVDATQQAVEEIFEDSALDLELENSAGELSVRFGNGSQLILSRQAPIRQLWLATRGATVHFDYQPDSERWLCDSSAELLGEVLTRLTFEQAGVSLEFEEL